MFIGMFGAMACPEGQVCEEEKGQPGLYLVQKQARQVLSANSSTREAKAASPTWLANGYYWTKSAMGQSCTAKCAESGDTCNPNWMRDGNKKALDMQAIFWGMGSNPNGIQMQSQCSMANGCEPANGAGYTCYYNGAAPYTNAWTKPDCNSCNDAAPSIYFFCTCEAPATGTPTTEAPTTKAPTTAVPTTEAPTTEAPTTDPTKSPTHAVACQPWCEGDSRAWATKCEFNACLACDNCADTPGQLKPGGQFCDGWCKFSSLPWAKKCTFKQACGDCTGC